MAIDARIALGVQPVQIENPLDQYGRVSQIQAMQQRNRLTDLMFQDKERELQQENALSGLYRQAIGVDGKVDRTKVLTGAAQSGLGARIPTLQKGFADQDKATADLEKARWDATSKKLEIAGQAFGYVRNNPTLEAANSVLDYLGQNGVYDADTVANYKQIVASNPAAIKQLADQAFQSVLGAKEQLSTFQTRNTGGTTDTLEINPVTGKTAVINSVKNTMSPDAIAADARGRESNALSRERLNFEKQNGGKAPAGYRWAPDGQSLVPIAGGPADPSAKQAGPATEDERKAAGWVAQAENAWKNMQGVIEANPSATKAGFMETAAGFLPGDMAANVARPADRQKFVQASSSLSEALLRAATGAGVNEYEAKQKVAEITPQVGDKPDVVEQKLASIPVYLESLRTRAGRALPPKSPAPAAPAAGGIKFLGFE